MAAILIVEDEEQIARFIELELIHEGYSTAKASDGRQGLEMALEGGYDLVLLDVCLPELNGLEVLRRLRRTSNLPVILLTARDAVMDKVSGLDAGADDYVTKPFAIEELLARIRRALKNTALSLHDTSMNGNNNIGGTDVNNTDVSGNKDAAACAAETQRDPDILIHSHVILDKKRHIVKADGHTIELTPREFTMLQVLLENTDIVLSRETLLDKVCGYDYMGETNIIDVYVRYLRSKLDDAFGFRMIQTVRGVGYVIRSGQEED